MDYTVEISGGASIVSVKPVFGRDSKCIICCSGYSIKVLSIATGECIHKLKGHKGPVTGVIINPDNQFQIYSTSSYDKKLIKWDYQDGVKLKEFNCEHPLVTLHTRPGTSDILATCKVTSIEHQLVSFTVKNAKKIGSFSRIMRVNGDKQNTVSIGCGGEYAASVQKFILTVYSFKQQKTKEYHLEQHDKVKSEFTCVVCHPTDYCIATGITNGKILLWNNLFGKKSVVKTPIHWHSLRVEDLSYTAEGSYLLSGGHECVLVKWQQKSFHRDTLPRLGSPIVGVTCSTDGTLYATCHSDNSVQVIANNLKVLQHYQGLTMSYSDQRSTVRPLPVGLQLDPRTKALVSNGRPGHLQFYSLHKDSQLFNLDIVCQNYISPENLNCPLVITDVENATFDESGDWLVTVERYDNRETAMEMRLKFWKYQIEKQRFSLNTCVDLPHSSPVSTLKFRTSSDKLQPMVVTTSSDGRFKLWTLVDDTDIYRESVCWSCESVGYYRDLSAGPADFSADGLSLAVGFEKTLTLWDPRDNALKHTFTVDTNINYIAFGNQHSVDNLVFTTKTNIIGYDVTSCSASWVFATNVAMVTKCPYTDHVAVFTDEKQLLVFTMRCNEPVLRKSNVSRHGVIGAIFVPHERALEDDDQKLLWQQKSQLYYMNSQQELLTVSSVRQKDDNTVQFKFTDNLPQTPFSAILSQKSSKSSSKASAQKASTATRAGESTFMKQMLTTPAHVLPAMNTLCKTFMESLLVPRTSQKRTPEDSDDEEEPIENRTDSESDMETETNPNTTTGDVTKASTVSQQPSITQHLEQLQIKEKEEFENLNREQFDWMEKVI